MLTFLPWFIVIGGAPGPGVRAGLMGLAWIINIALAEWVISATLNPSSAGSRAPVRAASDTPI